MSTIRVAANSWGDARIVDVQAVINSAVQAFNTHAEISHVDPIIVLHSNEKFPRALSDPALTGERIVTLATTDKRWSQLAYQFSHEYCHVFTRHYRTPLEHPFMWFEESLCELASIWCLFRMSEDWKVSPPYHNWFSYAESLRDYALQRFEGVKLHDSPEAFKDWLDSNLAEMSSNSTNRDLNQVVAVRQYPKFQDDPKSWKALQMLNRNPKLDGDFHSYLFRWHETVSNDLQNSVRAIAELLGFPLENETEKSRK